MADTPQASGADLARQALAAARANAQNTPTPQAKKTRPTIRAHRGERSDPTGLAGILAKLTAEQGWNNNLDGGSILAQWPTLCPQYVGLVQAVAYDDERGRLDLRPGSHAYAAQLRLLGGQLAKQINDKLGRPVVRTIRVLPVGNITTTQTAAAEPGWADAEAPVRTREDGCPGYQNNRAIALEHKPEPPPVNPYVQEAMARQENALRAGRQPETEHRDAVWAQDDAARKAGPAPGSVEESLARARAYARQQRAGRAPRQAFDVA
ncbi:DciA family protein [Streptomyces sp. LUP47B]|uniref:DciA family protein n=1 Tax=Streptomyces sp. LUP47B TaxID=1890286 RepID=UPI00085201B6|nr:DUF721 domain-containing protein [Streptomyces sp. LUP47B]